jgi:aconitate hydratase
LHLGVKAVIAKSFARIHRRNLIAQGIVALTFEDESDYDRAEVGQTWTLPNLKQELADGSDTITAKIDDDGEITLTHDLSENEREILIAGGLLSYLRDKEPGEDGEAQNGGGAQRTDQDHAGERAQGDEDDEDSGVIRESGQGVGGHHE